MQEKSHSKDIDKKLSRLEKWRSRKGAPPLNIGISLTEKCNLDCKFCPRGRFTRKGKFDNEELSEENIYRIIDEGAEMGVERIDLTGGGEQFYYREKAIKVLERIKDNDLSTNIITNGTLLDERTTSKIVEIGVDGITFSIDGASADIHDFLRGFKGSFKKVVESIKNINEFKDKNDKEKPKININTVLTRFNYHNLEEILEFLNELEIDSWQIQALRDEFPRFEKYKLKPEESKKVSQKTKYLSKRAKILGIENNILDFSEKGLIEKSTEMKDVYVSKDSSASIHERFKEVDCFFPWLSLFISSSGNIDICENFSKQSKINGRNLSEVWYNDSYINKMREKLRDGELPEKCENCCTLIFSQNQELKTKLNKQKAN